MNTTPPSAHHIFVQSVPASTMQPGVQATIVVDRNESHEGVERDFLVPHTVYLTGVEKNQRFQRFSDTFSTALAMPIQDYLNILLFFKIAWPEIELEMKKELITLYLQTKKIATGYRKFNVQTKITESVVYEKWFNTVYLQVRRTTHRPFQQIHIQRNNVFLKIDSSVVKDLASAYNSLIENLKSVNYQFA